MSRKEHERIFGGGRNVVCLVLSNGTRMYTIVEIHQTDHLRCTRFGSLLITPDFLNCTKKPVTNLW